MVHFLRLQRAPFEKAVNNKIVLVQWDYSKLVPKVTQTLLGLILLNCCAETDIWFLIDHPVYDQLQVQPQKGACEAFLQMIFTHYSLLRPVPGSIIVVLRKFILLTAVALPGSFFSKNWAQPHKPQKYRIKIKINLNATQWDHLSSWSQCGFTPIKYCYKANFHWLELCQCIVQNNVHYPSHMKSWWSMVPIQFKNALHNLSKKFKYCQCQLKDSIHFLDVMLGLKKTPNAKYWIWYQWRKLRILFVSNQMVMK